MRPILRPGTHVLRRGAGQLQVGLDPGSALVLPDTPSVRAGLRLLTTPAERASYVDRAPLDLLEAHGTLIDERDLMPLLAEEDVAPHATAALAREAGPELAASREARRRWRTETRSFGHPAGAGLRGAFVALAGAAGLREAAARRVAAPDGGVLVGVGEPDRDLVDAWTRAGTPHLLVRLTEGRAVIGPFVQPGSTACLRCLDAHCTDADPAWPLLVRQYAAAAACDRADGAPEPVDPLLASLAVAWAARDLVSYVDGRRPSTWSTTVTIHPRLSRLETRAWLRHPACGCSWA
jgi:bacteriocin biosynthesis cyclodehydratase domain-containing protein